MSIILEFYKNGVVLRHSGIITDEELLQAEHDIYDHAYPEQLQFQIVDLVEVEDFPASDETMRLLGQKDHALAKTLNRQHIVVIAPNIYRNKGIIWEKWAQGTNTHNPAILTRVVKTAEEAIQWLEGHGVDASSCSHYVGDIL
jgi:hypothetical protein